MLLHLPYRQPSTKALKRSGHPEHVPALDGVRGLAILSVVIWHYFDSIYAWFPGWAGVDLFFVLSGYLITGRLIQTRENPDYFRRFYRNRVLRIFPLYYTLLLVFYIFIIPLIQAKNLPLFTVYTDHWKSFFLFTENWTFIFSRHPADPSMEHLWSIAIEEQFYLLWPLVIFLIPGGKFRGRFMLISLLLVLLARSGYYFLTDSTIPIYQNTFFRMDSLLTGSLLYHLHDQGAVIRSRLVKGIAVLLLTIVVAGFALLHDASPYSGFMATAGFTLVAILFACLLQIAVQGEGVLPRLLRTRFLRFCGRISYCLYLIHFPIRRFLGIKLQHWGESYLPDHRTIVYYTVTLICLFLSFLISMISYRYFESWFLSLKSKPLSIN